MKESEPEFKGLRSILWPIHSYEIKKFLPMALMMMCILFTYSMLRGMKDSLVITTCGAEVIPTLKLWFVLPSAIVFMIIYSKLLNAFSKNAVFYIVTTSFLVYFVAFVFLLYPNYASLHTSFSVEQEWARTILVPVENWVFASFYIMAELWGSAMVSLMFWKFANETTMVTEAKRFYAMFGFVANGALILSGETLKGLSEVGNGWDNLPTLMLPVFFATLAIIFIYWFLNNCVLTDPRFLRVEEIKKGKKKEKMSLSDSFKYIISSKYLGFIVLLVVCYGISINLVEVVWKGQAKLAFPTKNEFNGFMGNVQVCTGWATILTMLVGANILRRCSWKFAAILTPLMILCTGLGFFAFIIFKDDLSAVLDGYGVTALLLSVYLGLAQNVLSKATKYSLFDPTKEMSYIPLDDELKSKGKAAVDVIGGRLGKSGGAAINWFLLLITGSSLVELAPVISVIFVGIMCLWFFAVGGLNKKFLEIQEKKVTE